jgi:hypothetical protein
MEKELYEFLDKSLEKDTKFAHASDYEPPFPV